MSEDFKNPYADYQQEIISPEIIAGYVYKYMPEYWNTTVDKEDFLTVVYSILDGESGMNKYVKSRENDGKEQSYGIFQIHWLAHRKTIFENYPQFREAGLSPVSVNQMTSDQHKKLAALMADLDFQFSFAEFLMYDKKRRGLNIFEDWTAYDTRATRMSKWSSVATSYRNIDGADLINFYNSYTPTSGGLTSESGEEIGETEPADSNFISREPVMPMDQWKQIKQAYGGEFYDYETDTWIGDYENQTGYKAWYSIFELGLEGDPNKSYDDWFADSLSDDAGNLESTWQSISNQEGFFNPFQLSSLSGPPTMADSVKIAVYNKFLRSASNSGFDAGTAQGLALMHLANPIAIDRMNRSVQYGMERGMTVQELIDIVSQDISSYMHEDDIKDWTFRLPTSQESSRQEQASLNEKINKKVSSVLLQDSPYLTDDIRNAYTDYKIVNPNTQVSIEDFAMPFIKQTDRYKRIYLQKPAMFSPEQYINQYVQGVGSVMAPGDSNYEEMIASQASMGGTAQEAQTGAFFGSANVALGDTFRNKVSSLGERIGAMFNK